MSHYSYEELLLYSKASVNEAQEAEIEEHLLTCEECNNTYIQIIESCYMEDESNNLPQDFTDNVMKAVLSDRSHNKLVKRKRVAPEVFVYYVAAACITLMLSINGVFDSLIGGFTDMTTYIASTPVSVEKAVSNGWTERLANDTSRIISELKNER
jgi:predicted anti-sigma-YlaC factor YlaD